MIDFLNRCFEHLGSILGTKLGPKSRSKRSQNAPKTPPRRHQDRPRATRAHKIEIWTIFDPNPPPSLDFRGLWAHFGTTFGAKFALRNFEKQLIKFKRSKKLTAKRGGGYAAPLRIGIRTGPEGAHACLGPSHGLCTHSLSLSALTLCTHSLHSLSYTHSVCGYI